MKLRDDPHNKSESFIRANRPNMLEINEERDKRLAKEMKAEAESKAGTQSSSDAKRDPLRTGEDMLGGLWQSLKKAGEYASDIFSSIAKGAENLRNLSASSERSFDQLIYQALCCGHPFFFRFAV